MSNNRCNCPPVDRSFVDRCLSDTLQGLREGLSHFSGPSTAAVIFSLPRDSRLFILDPDQLLRGHELKIRHFYYDGDGREIPLDYRGVSRCYSALAPVPPFELDGLLSHGGSSAIVPYQMWFTEHHPDIISTGPTKRWLAHAVLRFSHDVANDVALYTGVSGCFLREYATHAVFDHIDGETRRLTGTGPQLAMFQILDAILGILNTREEGLRPVGELMFIAPDDIPGVPFIARFKQHELPQLQHFKHVRKLLQTVAGSRRKLISDGVNIHGIASRAPALYAVTADYRGHYGYLRINQEPVCSFADGRYQSSSMRAKLFEVEEALLDYDLDAETRDGLFQIASALVHRAQAMNHGCTFVLDLNETPVPISGQHLHRPLDLSDDDLVELACGFSQVDGALHIFRDRHLYSFACLLDGHTVNNEDRARGARYNSALRFTAAHPRTLAVVVSADRPVSVIQQGIVLHDRCQWQSPTAGAISPEPLQDWLERSE